MNASNNIIEQGRQELVYIALGVILLSMGLTIYEWINWISPFGSGGMMSVWASRSRLILQTVDFVGLTIVLLGSFRGWPGRWFTFGLMFVTGLLQFYMAGSRIGEHVNTNLTNVGFGSYMVIAAALGFLGTAFYWGWSTPLGTFLTWKREQFLMGRGAKKKDEFFD